MQDRGWGKESVAGPAQHRPAARSWCWALTTGERVVAAALWRSDDGRDGTAPTWRRSGRASTASAGSTATAASTRPAGPSHLLSYLIFSSSVFKYGIFYKIYLVFSPISSPVAIFAMYEVFHFVHDVQAPFVIRVDTEEFSNGLCSHSRSLVYESGYWPAIVMYLQLSVLSVCSLGRWIHGDAFTRL